MADDNNDGLNKVNEPDMEYTTGRKQIAVFSSFDDQELYHLKKWHLKRQNGR